jgi:hypothetical protein
VLIFDKIAFSKIIFISIVDFIKFGGKIVIVSASNDVFFGRNIRDFIDEFFFGEIFFFFDFVDDFS